MQKKDREILTDAIMELIQKLPLERLRWLTGRRRKQRPAPPRGGGCITKYVQ